MKHKAKKEALKNMRKSLGSEYGKKMMGGGIAAEVIAKDPESLKKGLKKAAEVVDKQEEIMEPYESMDHEMMEECDEDSLMEMSKEELVEKLMEMMKK